MVSMRRRLRGISTRVTAAPEASAPAPVEEPTTDPDVDPILAGAVDVARRVAREAAGAKVGAHLGAEQEADFVVTHAFASNDPAYVGWRWVVTLTRADGDDKVTVDDVVLPGQRFARTTTVTGMVSVPRKSGPLPTVAYPHGTSVSFYNGQPGAGGVLLQTATTAAPIAAGGFADVAIVVPSTTEALPLWVVADDPATVDESDETNNAYDSGLYLSDEPNAAPSVSAWERAWALAAAAAAPRLAPATRPR